MTLRFSRAAGSTALLVGLAALMATARGAAVSWDTLLAPYAQGAPIVGEFRIRDLHRGAGNDVVLRIGRPGEGIGAEVHILPRGSWPGVRASRSFSIGYETPRSPAAERDAITAVIADALRARDHGLPSPGAIPLRSGDATALPWWLEALRGPRGPFLGISLILLGLLALVSSTAVAVAAIVCGGADLMVAAVGAPVGALDVGAPVTLVAAIALAAPTVRGLTPSQPDRRLGWLLIAAALSLRLGLGAWGPLHVNGQGPRFVAGAARDPSEIAVYGPGYVEIFSPLAALTAAPDWAVFSFNAICSAVSVWLTFAVARLAGVAAAPAFAAAVLVAVDPVAMRMSATESYFPPIILLCLIAAALLLAAGRARTSQRQWHAAAAVAAAALLLVQAARVHPSAWGPIACTLFVALAAPAGHAAPRGRMLLATALVSAGLCIMLSAGALLDVFANVRGGTLMRPLPPHSLTPLIAIAVLAAVYAVVAPRRWLAVPAALCAAAWIATRHGYDQSWIWQQSYDRLYLTLPLVAALAMVPASVLRQPWPAIGLALLLLAAWVPFALPLVRGRTTDHLEYRWLREQISALPAECRLIHLESAEKRVLGIPSYLPPARPAVAVDLRQPHTLAAALAPSPCAYYVRTSLCSSPEASGACAALEAHLTLVPHARSSLPAIPSSHLLSYTRDPVEIVVFRVDGVAPARAPSSRERGRPGEDDRA